AQVKADLSAKNRQRARARAVGARFTVLEDIAQQIVVGFHG
ncbi:MAG: hypothetical protein RLZZ224_359, partial [Verrucomicrobiota bacterium]